MSQVSRSFGCVMTLLGIALAASGFAFVTENENLRALLVGLGCGVAGIGLTAALDTFFGPTSQLLQRLDELKKLPVWLEELKKKLTDAICELSGTLDQVRAGLDDSNQQIADTVKTMGTEVGHLTKTVDGLTSSIPLLNMADKLGIRFFYRTREEDMAVDTLLDRYFPNDPVEVAKSREVIVVGSTIKGLYENDRIRDRVHSVIVEHQSPYRFLLTHWDFVSPRQSQENRAKASIAIELRETLDWLTNRCGVPLTSVRLYHGTPTCFMVISGKNMFLNPYPYEGVAYGSFCVEVENAHPHLPQGTNGSIWHQYYAHHYYRPWYGATMAHQVVRCNSEPLSSDWEARLDQWITNHQNSTDTPPNFPAPPNPPLGYI